MLKLAAAADRRNIISSPAFVHGLNDQSKLADDDSGFFSSLSSLLGGFSDGVNLSCFLVVFVSAELLLLELSTSIVAARGTDGELFVANLLKFF